MPSYATCMRMQACVIVIQPYLLRGLFIIADEIMSFLRCRHRFFHLVFHLPGIWSRCTEPDCPSWRERKREMILVSITLIYLSVSSSFSSVFFFTNFLLGFYFINYIIIVSFFLLKIGFNFLWISIDEKDWLQHCCTLLLFSFSCFSYLFSRGVSLLIFL